MVVIFQIDLKKHLGISKSGAKNSWYHWDTRIENLENLNISQIVSFGIA